MGGPVLNDHVNWVDFIPAISVQHYVLSPDCTVCDATDPLNDGLYQDHSACYMNPLTYECKICEWSEGTVLSRPYSTIADYNDDANTGICSFSIKPDTFQVATQFNECFNYQTTAFKPSLGTN